VADYGNETIRKVAVTVGAAKDEVQSPVVV